MRRSATAQQIGFSEDWSVATNIVNPGRGEHAVLTAFVCSSTMCCITKHAMLHASHAHERYPAWPVPAFPHEFARLFVQAYCPNASVEPPPPAHVLVLLLWCCRGAPYGDSQGCARRQASAPSSSRALFCTRKQHSSSSSRQHTKWHWLAVITAAATAIAASTAAYQEIRFWLHCSYTHVLFCRLFFRTVVQYATLVCAACFAACTAAVLLQCWMFQLSTLLGCRTQQAAAAC